MDNIREKQYDNLRKHFDEVTTEILGKRYYNMGGDVYTCDIITCKDIIRAYKQMKKERDDARKFLIKAMLVFAVIAVAMFILAM